MSKKWERKIASAVLAAVLVAGLTGGCANPERDGVEALKAKNYEEAKTQFKKSADSKDEKKAAQGYRGLGMTYFETEDYQAALDAFVQAEDMGAAKSVQMYYMMGVSAMKTEDYAAALEYIQAGLAMAETSDQDEEDKEKTADPDMIREMRYNEIICYEQQADWESAKEKAAEYLEAYPDDTDVQREAEFLETR